MWIFPKTENSFGLVVFEILIYRQKKVITLYNRILFGKISNRVDLAFKWSIKNETYLPYRKSISGRISGCV